MSILNRLSFPDLMLWVALGAITLTWSLPLVSEEPPQSIEYRVRISMFEPTIYGQDIDHAPTTGLMSPAQAIDSLSLMETTAEPGTFSSVHLQFYTPSGDHLHSTGLYYSDDPVVLLRLAQNEIVNFGSL